MAANVPELTKRQKEVYKFIREQIVKRGYGPTVREIGDKFKIKSPNGVVCHLNALEKKGFIVRESNMSRAISLTHLLDERGLPLAGRVAAGVMHEAVEQNERADFGAMFSKRGMFVLRVNDDSLIDEHIAEGDYVVIKKQRTAKKGQVALIDTGNGTNLASWNPKSKKNKVVGVLAGVVRNG